MLITLTVPPCLTLVWSAARSANSSLGFMTVGVAPRSRWPSSSNDTFPSRKSGTPLVSTTECIATTTRECDFHPRLFYPRLFHPRLFHPRPFHAFVIPSNNSEGYKLCKGFRG